jgi:two-component system cell cycle sensor histidine kinase/response regulator CckA
MEQKDETSILREQLADARARTIELEEQLRDRVDHFRTLVEHQEDLLVEFDGDWCIRYATPRYCRTFGKKPEEVSGKRFLPLIHEEDRPLVVDSLNSLAAPPHRTRHVERALTVNGWRWFQWFVSAIQDGAGGVHSFVAVGRDISEQRTSSERFRQLFQTIGSCVAVYQPVDQGRDFAFVDINPAAERHSRVTRGEVLGRRVTEVFPSVDAIGLLEVFREVHRTGKTRSLPATRYADGRIEEWVENTVYRLPNGQIVAVYEDISEQRVAEGERELLEQQLFQAQKMEAVGRLAGGIAHDFNNLLTGISCNVELCQLGMDDHDPKGEFLHEIALATSRGAALVQQLLAFGRKQVIEPVPLRPAELLRGISGLVNRLIGEHIQVIWELDPQAGPILGDRGQLEQVIVNLVVNARDAMPLGGRLTIRQAVVDLERSGSRRLGLDAPGRYHRIEVLDDGTGMGPAVLRRVFEPFYTTKAEGEGSGLGLATAFGIIEQHGGSIEASSTPGQGSRFAVYLPLVPAQDPPEPVVSPSPAPTPPALGTGARILLVEDDQLLRRSLERLLTRRGYAVVSAPSGVDALELVDSGAGPFALLLSDVVMPGMGGPELARLLSAQFPTLQVLLSSGYSEDIVASQGGVIDERFGFIGKPYDSEELLRRIAALLER